MMSITRPNRAFFANARPRSASSCTSTSGSPAARRFVFTWPQLYAAKVRSPTLFAAESTEPKPGLVVAETRSGYHAKPYIGHARTVAVATLEAEINRPTDGQGKKVHIRMQCRRQDLGQHIQCRQGYLVAHQG